MEEWRDIEGYEGFYQVSNTGLVKSLERRVDYGHIKPLRRERILRPKTDKDGYRGVRLQRNGTSKHFRVCRLVAIAFIPNPNNLPFVNHKDEIKSNDTFTNLEWCTQQYNANYGTVKDRTRRKLYKKVYCGVNGKTYESESHAAVDLEVSLQAISDCLHGRRKNKYNLKFVI